MRAGWIILVVALMSMGCVEKEYAGDDPYRTSPGGPISEESHDPAAVEREKEANGLAVCGSADLEAAAVATDKSVHELVTCGGMQVSLAQSFVGILLLSNERMFDERSKRELEQYSGLLPRNEFTDLGDGAWRMDLGPESNFDVRFFDPNTGDLITVDPLDMESYLIGLEATYDMSFEEMVDKPHEQNRWVFTWTEPGPLAHLMNGGDPVPQQFEVILSLEELAALIFPAWFGGAEQPSVGPFDSLFDIEMDSKIFLRDERAMLTGTAMVDYQIVTPRVTVGEIAARNGLDFEVVRLTSTVDEETLVESENSLEYAGGVGALAGALVMISDDDDEVTLDFGEGASYPETQWSCR